MQATQSRILCFTVIEVLITGILSIMLISATLSFSYRLFQNFNKVRSNNYLAIEISRFQSDFNKLFYFNHTESIKIDLESKTLKFTTESHYPEFSLADTIQNMEVELSLKNNSIYLQIRQKGSLKKVTLKYFQNIHSIDFTHPHTSGIEEKATLLIEIIDNKKHKTPFLFLDRSFYKR
ncbi:MAG: hypothetical protein GWP59_04195 [Chlamydiales bacterium]|nr:hypothetical protein [Chlamydiales bacterium]